MEGKRERERELTSAEHFATAAAKVSIGRVRPGMIAERDFCKTLDQGHEGAWR